jgi:four helix bundle protein
MHSYSFEKLDVWQNARKMTAQIYKITNKFPENEKYGLVSQIRRASVSIAANIAEGSARTSSKDQAYFTQIAYSSMIELLNHFYIASDLNYINNDEFKTIREYIEKISNQLNALRKSQLNRKAK